MMRPGQNKRPRGRTNVRKSSNPLSRTYESSGPDVKIRGTAHHLTEKYLQLARDAQSSDDRVMAENYLQHAEHYFRIISAHISQQQTIDGHPAPAEDSEQDEGEGDLPDRFASFPDGSLSAGSSQNGNGEDGGEDEGPGYQMPRMQNNGRPDNGRPERHTSNNRYDNRPSYQGQDDRNNRRDARPSHRSGSSQGSSAQGNGPQGYGQGRPPREQRSGRPFRDEWNGGRQENTASGNTVHGNGNPAQVSAPVSGYQGASAGHPASRGERDDVLRDQRRGAREHGTRDGGARDNSGRDNDAPALPAFITAAPPRPVSFDDGSSGAHDVKDAADYGVRPRRRRRPADELGTSAEADPIGNLPFEA